MNRIKSLPLAGRPEEFWIECLRLVPAWHRPHQKQRLLDEDRSARAKPLEQLTEPERVAIRVGAGARMSGSTTYMCCDKPADVLQVDGEYFVEIA
jgi:hypothetical protein